MCFGGQVHHSEKRFAFTQAGFVVQKNRSSLGQIHIIFILPLRRMFLGIVMMRLRGNIWLLSPSSGRRFLKKSIRFSSVLSSSEVLENSFLPFFSDDALRIALFG